MKHLDSSWSLALALLLFAGCLGAQLVQTPKKSPYAPAEAESPLAMVRYPLAPMSGTIREFVSADYSVKKREDAYQLMFESCGGPDYKILREAEVVVEGEAVWKELHYRCDQMPSDGGVAAPPLPIRGFKSSPPFDPSGSIATLP